MDNKTKVDLKKYVVNVQGKDFITFPGLLAMAHELGLTSIDTELIQPIDLNSPVVKATVKLGDRTFSGYGDATSTNVAKKVAGALIRMAETRAIARALRFACNIEMTALEELPGDGEEPTTPKKSTTTTTTPRKSFSRGASVTVQETTGDIPVSNEGEGTEATPVAQPTQEQVDATATKAAKSFTVPQKSPFSRQKTTTKTQEPSFP